MNIDRVINTMSSVPIRGVKKGIDRMQFSLFAPRCDFRMIRELAMKCFGKLTPKKVDGKLVYNGQSGETAIQLLQKGHYWIEFCLHDPDEDTQLLSLDFIDVTSALRPGRKLKAYLSQVEFFVDVYPHDPQNNVDRLWLDLAYPMVRRYPRDDSFGIYKKKWTTHYHGTHGNVREGSYGIRVYGRPKRRTKLCLRIELQANSALLRKEGLSLHSLPLDGTELGILDYVEFRRHGTMETAKELAEKIVRRKLNRMPILSPRDRKGFLRRKGRSQALKEAMERLIAEEMFSVPYDGNLCCFPQFVPVAWQVGAYKRMAKERSVPVKIEDAFPKIDFKVLKD